MSLSVHAISALEHRAYIAAHPKIPLRQTPGWARGFESCRTESIGWFEGDTLIGAGLVRYRGLPRLPMRTIAVLSGGPDIDWTGQRRPQHPLTYWTEPLGAFLRKRGAIAVRVNPNVTHQDWWAIDPAERSDSTEVAHRDPESVRWEKRRAEDRLSEAGWQHLNELPRNFLAEVVIGGGTALRKIEHLASDNALMAGYTVRTGRAEELPRVHRAVTDLHRGIRLPSLGDLARRWEGLVHEEPGSVKLLVVEQRGETVYGGLVAVTGGRAWDLSAQLPEMEAERGEVQVLRAHMIAHAAMTGSRSLVIPTIRQSEPGQVQLPAPGWPPAQLHLLMGTWQQPLRTNWHAAVAPVVDRLVL